MKTETQNVDFVRRFCDHASESATFNLDVLRAVDYTVTTLSGVTKSMRGQFDLTVELESKVQACQLSQPLDPDGTILDKLAQAVERMSKVQEILQVNVRNALQDNTWRGHREDIEPEVADATEAATSLRDATISLRDSLAGHDRRLQESIGSFSSVEELLAALKS